MLTKLTTEHRGKNGAEGDEIKNYLNHIANIARRFCLTSKTEPHPEIAKITNEHDLLEAMSTMLTENKALRETINNQQNRIGYLEELATSDELTGVLNRRGFEAELKRVLARAKRNAEQGVLVYIDLDEFKPVNDTHGHAAGDEVLRNVATILAEQTRDMDIIGRLGGDEFAIILVNTQLKNGLERAETLNKTLNATQLNWQGQQLNIQASFGMQSYQSGDDAHALLQSADEAMYKIKRIKEAEAHPRQRSTELKSPRRGGPLSQMSQMAGNA